MRSSLTRMKAASALALILAVAVAGCGGSSSSSPSDEAAAPATVAPKGAPYSYTVPSGFEEIPGDFPAGETPRFLTLVVPEGTEDEGYLIAYQWSPFTAAEKRSSTRRLLRYLDMETRSFYATSNATVGPTRHETVAGHPAVCWKIDGFYNKTEGLVDADSCAIAVERGVAVEQSCSWKSATEAAMKKGCAELRAGLKVFPPAS